jgi:hypothetical protein
VTALEALRKIEAFLAEELAVRKGSYEPDPTPFDLARDAIRAAGEGARANTSVNCSDCPPSLFPTNKTRCTDCPLWATGGAA